MSVTSDAAINSFQTYLQSCRGILALIGAGLSQASGIPPFRGLNCENWNGYDASDLCTPEAFCEDPLLVWQFHAFCRQRALKSNPNGGHIALAKLASIWEKDMLTVTQNFDGLSERAGHPQEYLVDMHGNLFNLRCTNVQCNFRKIDFDPNLGTSEVPKCPKCSALLRPAVVWFGELVPYNHIVATNEAIETNRVDLVLCIGISAEVWPAAGYRSEVVKRGGKVAVVNPDSGTKVKCDWLFKGGAEQWLPIALNNI
mgnify:FL=1